MDLSFDLSLSASYENKSQIARVLTESWVEKNIFCPSCGGYLANYENNKPVADFYCASCKEDYELKSKQNSMGKKIVDGAILHCHSETLFHHRNNRKTKAASADCKKSWLGWL
jgi:type II restriction enzyme